MRKHVIEFPLFNKGLSHGGNAITFGLSHDIAILFVLLNFRAEANLLA